MAEILNGAMYQFGVDYGTLENGEQLIEWHSAAQWVNWARESAIDNEHTVVRRRVFEVYSKPEVVKYF
jgi:hypothetical protein